MRAEWGLRVMKGVEATKKRCATMSAVISPVDQHDTSLTKYGFRPPA